MSTKREQGTRRVPAQITHSLWPNQRYGFGRLNPWSPVPIAGTYSLLGLLQDLDGLGSHR